MAARRQLLVQRVGAYDERHTGSDGDRGDLGPLVPVHPTEIFDARVLDGLVQDLGKPAAERLVEQYCDGLKQQLEVLTAAALDRSLWLTYDTAIDLAVTSATVGAAALARAARAVAQNAVRYRIHPQVEDLERLMRLAHDTEAALARRRQPDPPALG